MHPRNLIRLAVAVAAVALLGAAPVGAAPRASILRVSMVEDALGLSSRLVFSTARQAATPPRTATLSNAGSSPINVTNLTIAGLDANQFVLALGQPKSFTINPGGSAQVRVRFAPTSNGNKFSTLTIANNSTVPSFQVRLRGVSARGTLGNQEPQLAELMQLYGYSTNVGFTAGNQATTRVPRGEEVISPYFVRASGSAPVTLTPIAKYTGANLANGQTGRTPENSFTKQQLYRFPPDAFVDDTPGDGQDDSVYVQNQKTFPVIAAGGFSFNPTGTFGLYANIGNYSDDRFNTDDTGVPFHNVRVYPARGEGGVVLPNRWLIAVDVNTDPPDKNFDYQDQLMVLNNARPALTPGPAPGGAATNLSFTSSVGGTIADRDGQGTGFSSVQANKNGSQYKPALIDLTAGRLRITSTVGKNTGSENLQNNALQLGFDGTRSDLFIQARVLGPMSDLTAGFQQKAVYFGPDQDNYLKIEIEHRSDNNGVFITVLREQSGSTATVGQVRVNNPGSVLSLDLAISADIETGFLRGAYRINSTTAAFTNLGSTYRPPAIMRFFSPQARAGILVSHTESNKVIVGNYDSFKVGVS